MLSNGIVALQKMSDSEVYGWYFVKSFEPKCSTRNNPNVKSRRVFACMTGSVHMDIRRTNTSEVSSFVYVNIPFIEDPAISAKTRCPLVGIVSVHWACNGVRVTVSLCIS